jgi:type II restriction enzyme
MNGWKRGKPHAIVVCPIYQLPTRSSQIYQQAIARNVCIFTYSHLAVLIRLQDTAKGTVSEDALFEVLRCAETLNPTKDAVTYWTCLNRTMLNANSRSGRLWEIEKQATMESIVLAKEEALTFLAREREQIMRMSRTEAIRQLIGDRNIDGKERVIKAVGDNGILTIS